MTVVKEYMQVGFDIDLLKKGSVVSLIDYRKDKFEEESNNITGIYFIHEIDRGTLKLINAQGIIYDFTPDQFLSKYIDGEYDITKIII